LSAGNAPVRVTALARLPRHRQAVLLRDEWAFCRGVQAQDGFSGQDGPGADFHLTTHNHTGIVPV
jgi:hypothetical protein